MKKIFQHFRFIIHYQCPALQLQFYYFLFGANSAFPIIQAWKVYAQQIFYTSNFFTPKWLVSKYATNHFGFIAMWLSHSHLKHLIATPARIMMTASITRTGSFAIKNSSCQFKKVLEIHFNCLYDYFIKLDIHFKQEVII